MARYGKTPVIIPKGVEVKVVGNEIKVKGPKGELAFPLTNGIELKIDGDKALLSTHEKSSLPSAVLGLHRSMVSNMVEGVNKGFEIKLAMVGVGYRATVSGTKLDLQIGYSHPVKKEIPKSIKVVVDKNINLTISGIDKQEVGQFAAEVRALKKPEPYKGKGIRYENERVRKKAGKAAKGKTA